MSMAKGRLLLLCAILLAEPCLHNCLSKEPCVFRFLLLLLNIHTVQHRNLQPMVCVSASIWSVFQERANYRHTRLSCFMHGVLRPPFASSCVRLLFMGMAVFAFFI